MRFPGRKEAIARFAVSDANRSGEKRPNRYRWLVLLALASVFLFFVARFRAPGKGFTTLINFGAAHASRYLPEVSPESTFFTPDSDGYDSQWYAQLALEPDLRDPRLEHAIDNLPYRARRILFCWTAYVLGMGQPRWILEAFALQNVVCWLLLGWLLLRWLPPTDWGNVLRWFFVQFSFGMAFSIRGALVDGPSLLLIASGVALLETGRPWLAALTLGVSGLGKETCILSGAALLEPRPVRDLGGWMKTAARGLLVAAPLLLWTSYIIWIFGSGGTDAGSRNFALPFAEFWNKAETSFRELVSDPPVFSYALGGALTVVSLATQLLFFALRPRWSDPWWRIGAAYCILMAVLGESVWEGYPSAAARVLLPMLLAFNLSVPKGPRWWAVLLLGNATLISTPNFVRLPIGLEPTVLSAPQRLLAAADGTPQIAIELAGPWYHSEASLGDTWRWTGGAVEIVVRSEHDREVEATLSFGLNCRTERTITVAVGNHLIWEGTATPRRQEVAAEGIKLVPGETRIRIASDVGAGVFTDSSDRRPLDFRVLDLSLGIREIATSP